MPSIRSPFGNTATLATADALTGTVDNSQILNLKGAAGALIAVLNLGTAGTTGIDIIEFSRDGGITWAACTAANVGKGYAGLLRLSDQTVVTSAALEAAGIEPVTVATHFFFLPAPDGPFHIRCARGGAGAGGTAWTTGAPVVVATRIG